MLDKLLIDLADQAPVIVLVIIVIWLSLPTLAERFTIIGKLLRPLSRRWRQKAAALAEQQKAEALRMARELAKQAMAEMTPPDYAAMQKRLDRYDETLERVQDAEALLRAFVIYDELWHFHDDRAQARHGRIPSTRIPFDMFEERWQKGWRPFDDEGHLIADAESWPPKAPRLRSVSDTDPGPEAEHGSASGPANER